MNTRKAASRLANTHTHMCVNFPVDFINVCWIVFHKHVYFTVMYSLLNMFVINSTLAGFFAYRGKKHTFVFVCGTLFTHLIDCHIRKNLFFFAHWTPIPTWNSVTHWDGYTDTRTHGHTHRGRNGECDREQMRGRRRRINARKPRIVWHRQIICMLGADYGHTILCYD